MTLNVNILSDIGDWMKSKQLKLNENKTECIIIGRQVVLQRLNVLQIMINDTAMPVKKTSERHWSDGGLCLVI